MKHVNMTITIPAEIREKMKKFKNVNWSEVARRAFEEEIKKIERRIAAEEIDKLREESTIEWSGEDQKMERLVLDSSIVVKWFSRESDTEKALEIRDAHVRGEIEILATPLLLCEVANILKYKPDFDAVKLKRAIKALYMLHLNIEDIDYNLLAKAAEIAYKGGVTIYDALPVAQAEKHKTICITADKKT